MRNRILLEGKKENLALINPVLDAIVPMGRDPLTVRRDDPAIDLVEKYREKIKENWVATVERASTALTKQDVLSWYLRLALQYTIRSWAKALDPVKVGAMEQAYFRKVGLSVDNDDFEGNASLARLVHFLSLPIAGIRNYQYRHQSFREVMSDFQDMEDRWAATVDRLIDDEDDSPTPVIDFGNGWFWMNLNKPSCDKEARAMGHCGNSPRDGSQDTILSLRKKVQYGDLIRWSPALTFILTQDGMLTEMKGRGNDKPVAKYHKMIIALLLNPIVKGIVGGGYKPENNFSLDDLPEDDRKALLEKKPKLGTLWDQYQVHGLSDDVKNCVYAIIKDTYKYSEIYDFDSGGFIILRYFDDLDSFLNSGVDFLKPSNLYLDAMLKVSEGDFEDDLHWLGEDDAIDALDLIIQNTPDITDPNRSDISDFIKRLRELTGVDTKSVLDALRHIFPDAIEAVFDNMKTIAMREAMVTIIKNIAALKMAYRPSHCHYDGEGVTIRAKLDTFIYDLSRFAYGNDKPEGTFSNGIKRAIYYDWQLCDGIGDHTNWSEFFVQERQRFLNAIIDLFHTGVD